MANMGFRKQKSTWNKWKNRYINQLIGMGVPVEVLSDGQRWYIFLEHDGFDEWGWFENGYGASFDFEKISVDQAQKLIDFLIEHYGDEFDGFRRKLANRAKRN